MEHEPRLLAPCAYDPGTQRWEPSPEPPSTARVQELVVVTWNVWFGEFFLPERCDALLDEVASHDPDVIALQEVTPPFLERALALPWLRRGYAVSDPTGETFDGYGVVLLTRLPVRELVFERLPSRMGRALLAATLDLGGVDVTVATVHLESLRQFAARRQEQLTRILGVLHEQPHDALLVGDLNLFDERLPEVGAFDDLWPRLYPHDPGYTCDPRRNVMRAAVRSEEPPKRLDRMILRSAAGALRPRSMALLGTRPLPDNPRVFPSDHFGLRGTFAIER